MQPANLFLSNLGIYCYRPRLMCWVYFRSKALAMPWGPAIRHLKSYQCSSKLPSSDYAIRAACGVGIPALIIIGAWASI